MLGDQLIKNELIAINELIKNSYDADADWVKVSFENFGEDYATSKKSRIIIEDNGVGMTREIIENAWMNPATPNKYSRDNTLKKTLIKHRVVQGEKGIGRYAMLKLGSTIDMTTRPLDGDVEYSVHFDVSGYGDEFVTEDHQQDQYLDQLVFKLEMNDPDHFIARNETIGVNRFDDNAHGTRIVISNLRGKWNQRKMEDIRKSFYRFGNFFNIITNGENSDDFYLGLYFNGEYLSKNDTSESNVLRNLLDTQSVFQITNGCYISSEKKFVFKLNGEVTELSLDDPRIKGNILYRRHFTTDPAQKIYRDISDFGNFEFDFYIFDLAARGTSKYALSEEARNTVRKHRVYLMRDGIRVMPYGDPDDDWLQIDVNRGTISAGKFLSNDQVVGQVSISKQGNEHLKDKTNREGLIEDENYTSDFIAIISVFLSYLRTEVYKKYLERTKKKNDLDIVKKNLVPESFKEMKEHFKNDSKAKSLIAQLERRYKSERVYFEERVKRTESLAAVGLSVEVSSHDIMLMFNKGMETLGALREDCCKKSFDISMLPKTLERLYGIFSYVRDKIKDMQLLFVSSKQTKHQIRVEEILNKVIRTYKSAYDDAGIQVDVIKKGSPLVASCTDADLLQILINLFDNSLYWLTTVERDCRLVSISMDGDTGQLIFSDNGPGIRDDDAPYVFDAFFSGKGQKGRGMGLYISRQIMERNDYSIRLAEYSDEKILEGANFVVSFVKQEDD
jgi:signal transduction histidine kinase